MNLNIKTLILEAVREALEVAQHAAEKQRPIKNICAEAICNRFLNEKEEAMAKDTNSNIFWLTAFIESDRGLDEAPELDVIVSWIKDGFISGFDEDDSGNGQYVFDVYSRDYAMPQDQAPNAAESTEAKE
ncbi:MAG: hypothetical protein SWN10_20060 [Pseudomonadota bacterium]|uniref:Uncharacterized protein n=1 Tax=Marinobacter nauticus TaxID=2743 RepID=A0A368X8J9_MARNT|nr:hypothetical protein [Marinobacter nauticus]MDY6929389.1 hypothetical protein [Pseudomonadota bacterium]RCW63318.1 hypothetical protein DET61_11988 [Marinobacter nauticus]